MDQFSVWLRTFDESGWQGLAGLFIGIIGFGITIWQVLHARSAAEEAKAATDAAVAELKTLKAVTDLSAAISELDGVRRLLREESWSQLPERLSYCRKLLIGVGAKSRGLEAENANILKDAVGAFSEIEKQIDSASRGKSRLNEDKINRILIDKVDALYGLISSLV